ncbi:hypothetical protein PG999_000056 [Apiospora kogelbergensis]|uniref:DUF7770 domain-containing protein n=1 Tax=Apiospora kogelbergensis TaxID=1337665 RepID=A0AAW0RAM7_9PEZI
MTAILDSNWDIETSYEALQAEVTKFHICALRNEFNKGEDDQPPTNHWVVCLETSPDSCIMLDMVPGYGEDGLRGKIHVTALPRQFTDETLRYFTYLPTSRISVTAVLESTQTAGRQIYTFSPEWEGCRYWISVVVDDLETAGHLESGASKHALDKLSLYWVNPEGQEPREMNKGTFP